MIGVRVLAIWPMYPHLWCCSHSHHYFCTTKIGRPNLDQFLICLTKHIPFKDKKDEIVSCPNGTSETKLSQKLGKDILVHIFCKMLDPSCRMSTGLLLLMGIQFKNRCGLGDGNHSCSYCSKGHLLPRMMFLPLASIWCPVGMLTGVELDRC